MKMKVNKKEKVYCKDCKYCGEPVHCATPDYLAYMPLVISKNFYSHGVEIEQRYCNSPDVENIDEFDTFYTHIKNHFNPVCHEINMNNDCKYFKKKR